MKTSILGSILLLAGIHFSYSQPGVVACCSDTICEGESYTLSATWDSIMGGQTLEMVVDDSYTDTIDLGFDFTFFGISYSKCVLSTNGYIDFDITNAFMYSPWPIDEAIPSPNLPLNSIFGPYHDLDASAQPFGSLEYGTFGDPGSRVFVYSMCEVPLYECYDSLNTQQILLYESSNNIEIHLTNKTICPNWNDAVAIEGIQNNSGTIAYLVPGRNYPDIWSATNDAWRFVPDGTGYDILSIPHSPLQLYGSMLIWKTLAGDTVDTGNTISVSPLVTTTYVVSTTSFCGFSSDTVVVYVEECFPTSVGDILSTPLPDDASVMIFDETGRLVMNTKYSALNKAAETLPSGLYLLKISDQNQLIETRKIFLSK
jgi:hypothetical protein